MIRSLLVIAITVFISESCCVGADNALCVQRVMRELGQAVDVFTVWSEMTNQKSETETSALQISNWFEERGIYCRVYATNGALPKVCKPCICHMRNRGGIGHFVVLFPTNTHEIRIWDPNPVGRAVSIGDIDAVIVASFSLDEVENIQCVSRYRLNEPWIRNLALLITSLAGVWFFVNLKLGRTRQCSGQ